MIYWIYFENLFNNYNFYEYYVLIYFLSFCFFLILLLLMISFIVSPALNDKEKLSPYECGFEPFGDSRNLFDVQFYLIALLFIIFDLEIAFLLPWIIALPYLPSIAINSMGFFFKFFSFWFLIWMNCWCIRLIIKRCHK